MSEPRTRTKYAYDALHRQTSITYPSGPNSGNTPGKFFVYDSATVDGNAMGNAKSRLAEAYTATCQTCSKTTDEGFNYTLRGEVTTVYESTPHSSGYFWVTQSYWANGTPDLETNNLGNLTGITNGVDGEGRVSTVSAGTGQNPVTSTSYNAASEATALTLGSADSDAFSFDPNTFRMTQYQFNVNGQAVTGALTWNANGSLGKLAITDAFNAANTQTCTYSHDDLARIASGNCGSVWSQTFTYDAFGNLTKAGTNSFNPGYNTATNRMSTGATYDANGDVLTDSLHSYAWDVETRPTTIDTVTATYDALGRMVEQTNSGTSTEIVYDCMGNKLALMNTKSTVVKAFTPLPGGGTAVYNASGLQYYRHPDWLGSSRFSSTPSRTMYNDLAYAPFGEQYAAAGTTGITNVSFAGNNQDTTTNLYDAANREYEILGRWPSPDPAGSAAANPANPQSWNRYAYVLNNPLIFTDPTGLDTYPCPTQSDPYRVCTTVTVTGDGGGGDGGGWDGWTGGSGGGSGGGSSGPPCTLGNVLSPVFGHGEAAVLSPVYGRSYAAGCGGWGRGGQNGTPKTTPPQTPTQAATQYCQQHGQLSFNIPFTHIPVTISLSATLGPANYSATNDINAVFPVFPWPEWLAGGASVDFTINAPAQPTANPSVGLGKNLSLGYFTSHNGPQGISLSLGPSIGPPINVGGSSEQRLWDAGRGELMHELSSENPRVFKAERFWNSNVFAAALAGALGGVLMLVVMGLRSFGQSDEEQHPVRQRVGSSARAERAMLRAGQPHRSVPVRSFDSGGQGLASCAQSSRSYTSHWRRSATYKSPTFSPVMSCA